MKKKSLFVCTLLSLCAPVGFAQTTSPPLAGNTYTGVKYGSNTSLSGYYYFKNDSTFLFINYLKQSQNISEIGVGKWHFTKNILFLQFLPSPTVIQTKNTCIYHSYTVNNPDSIFIKISVLNNQDLPVANASIVFPQLNKAGITNSDGKFSVSLLQDFKVKEISVLSIGYSQQKIILQNNNNLHDIKVRLTPYDESAVALSDTSSSWHKLIKTTNNQLLFTGNLKLSKLENGNNTLEEILKKEQINKPLNKAIYSYFLRRFF